LVEVEAERLPEVLLAMQDAEPLAANWMRGAVDVIAERAVEQGRPLPQAKLERILADRHLAPRARRLAYEWIVRVDRGAPARLLPGMLDDPSLEMRRDAVAMLIERADAKRNDNDTPAAVALLQQAFAAARAVDQITTLEKKLAELEHPVDVRRHFGFLATWHLIAPFDNTDKGGFGVAYPPEREIDLAASYPGKTDKVAWRVHTTENKFGVVDLNRVIGKHMGVVGYAYGEFSSSVERDAELRLGCINANKVWLNGELLIASPIYHAGTSIDQYIMPVRLRAGANRILLKVCQNEQKEEWAQRWQFQLRVCDSLGTAIAPNQPK